MPVYGYARVSTATQANEGTSLDEQRRRIAGHAQAQGWNLDKVFADRGVSGAKPLADRPQGRALLDTLQSGDVVIGYRLDRMFRSAADALAQLEDFKTRRVELHLLDLPGGDVCGNGYGALIFTIMSAVAAFERERLNERIREGKAAAAAENRYAGGPEPFGFTADADGYLHPDPASYPGREMAEQMAGEGQSARAIHRALTAAGYSVSLPTVSKLAKAARAKTAA